MVAEVGKGVAKKGGGDVEVTQGLQSRVPDGFYQLRVRAAVAAAGEALDIAQAARYIEVRSGRWTELDDNEWFTRSDASLALNEQRGI